VQIFFYFLSNPAARWQSLVVLLHPKFKMEDKIMETTIITTAKIAIVILAIAPIVASFIILTVN